jgi:hypothetical protein
MNQEQYDEVLAAAKWWQAEGGRIIEQIWTYVDSHNVQCRCPLGAFCEANRFFPESGNAARLLDATESQIDAFIEGFDDGIEVIPEIARGWYEAGQRMRRELLGDG